MRAQHRRRRAFLIVCALAVCVGWGVHRIRWGNPVDSAAEALAYVQQQEERLLQFAGFTPTHAGCFFHEPWSMPLHFWPLWTHGLISVETGKEGRLIFSFPSPCSEGGRQLIYSPDDAWNFCDTPMQSLALGPEQEGPVRLSGVGNGGKGFVECQRILEHWFFLDYNLPT